MEVLHKAKENIEIIRQAIKRDFLNLDTDKLNLKPNPDAWSILECFEHLNRYAAYYLPELERGVKSLENTMPPNEWKPTFLGKKSIESVAPENMKAQKTFKRMNPVNSHLEPIVMNKFLEYQDRFANIIDSALKVNANKKIVKIEFMKFMKLTLADTILFMDAHQRRHLAQARKLV